MKRPHAVFHANFCMQTAHKDENCMLHKATHLHTMYIHPFYVHASIHTYIQVTTLHRIVMCEWKLRILTASNTCSACTYLCVWDWVRDAELELGFSSSSCIYKCTNNAYKHFSFLRRFVACSHSYVRYILSSMHATSSLCYKITCSKA